jgi:hypothetical protein
MRRFNGSMWHALWVLCPLAGLVFWAAFRAVRKGGHFFFDPKHNKNSRLHDAGDYGPHMQCYQDLAKLVITLSAAAIAFLINTLIGQRPPIPESSQKFMDCAPIVVGYFGAAIAFLVAFLVVQDVWYEEYCHSPDHSTYKAWKYATSTSLGYAGLVSFVLGFGWLATSVFW